MTFIYFARQKWVLLVWECLSRPYSQRKPQIFTHAEEKSSWTEGKLRIQLTCDGFIWKNNPLKQLFFFCHHDTGVKYVVVKRTSHRVWFYSWRKLIRKLMKIFCKRRKHSSLTDVVILGFFFTRNFLLKTPPHKIKQVFKYLEHQDWIWMCWSICSRK